MMDTYRLDENRMLSEGSEVSLDVAVTELCALVEHVARLVDDGESVTGVGNFILKKEGGEYLRIECDKPDEVMFSGNWLPWGEDNVFFEVRNSARRPEHLQFRASKERGVQVVRDFFQMSRKEFQRNYEAGRVRRLSSSAIQVT